MSSTNPRLEAALTDRGAWLDLVRDRRGPVRQFLRWARTRESLGEEASLRFENRKDVARCRRTLPMFSEPWWGVAVYSCFDSEIGSRAAATSFRAPLPRAEAEKAIRRITFPPRSVQEHRAQATLKRAKFALSSICDKAPELELVFRDEAMSFDQRLRQIERVDIDGWGRTTEFDALARAGLLEVAGVEYRPQSAYLAGSTGPRRGFTQVWDIDPAGDTEPCEQLLRQWSRDWDVVTAEVGVGWDGRPYDSADFENALCIFQERRHKGLPKPADFAENESAEPARIRAGR
jgi:hypothetical protein